MSEQATGIEASALIDFAVFLDTHSNLVIPISSVEITRGLSVTTGKGNSFLLKGYYGISVVIIRRFSRSASFLKK